MTHAITPPPDLVQQWCEQLFACPMTDSTLKQIIFDEWAIDVTCAKYSGAIAFVPICGDEVVWGLTMIQGRAPGPLVGVVSQDGMTDVEQWVADNPDWMLCYTKAEELCDD